MKKIFVLLLVVVMSLSVSVSAYAAPNGFTVSPGANLAPELVEFDKESLDCLARLVVTAYVDRFSLPDDTRALIEKAYADIVAADDLSVLSDELRALAGTLGVDTKLLAVSDLFDISYYDCDDHSGHGGFSLVLKPETLQGFVGLLHLKDGKWDLVENAKIEADGAHLSFSVDTLSPFAIVVQSEEGSEKPPASGDRIPVGAIAMLVVSVCAGAVVLVSYKKKKA